MGQRLRFAPSPTGLLHVGNARTALVNWLVARHSGGSLVLRIEDTDVERSDEENEATILADLAWLGIEWDEGPDIGGPHGPYRQSERLDRYAEVARRLVASGWAYPCFQTVEKVESMRQQARRDGETFRFRGEHRDVSPDEAGALIEQGGAALRFKVPDREVRFVDDLRGETGLAAGEIGDFVIARADGTPTYNFAVVVDDHDMRIDRVVRGEDHLPNTPRQILLYEALEWQPPAFAHLPLVLGPDRSRLSKRHGATSVAEIRDGGVLPEALCNFLALLGWSPPEQNEVLRPAELEAAYDISAISAANSVFDLTKLEWLNGQHMALLSPGDLLDRAAPFLVEAGIELPRPGPEREWWAAAAVLAGGGGRRLTELATRLCELVSPSWDGLFEANAEVRDDQEALAVVGAFAASSRAGELDSEEAYLDAVSRVRDATGATGRRLFHPLRLAISGRSSGPELKQLIPLLEGGARLALEPAVAGVAERIDRALGSRRS